MNANTKKTPRALRVRAALIGYSVGAAAWWFCLWVAVQIDLIESFGWQHVALCVAAQPNLHMTVKRATLAAMESK